MRDPNNITRFSLSLASKASQESETTKEGIFSYFHLLPKQF
ncbi:hypothetical protein HMPREF9074_09324 [Capnocytophaga sp. oral taxon 329 str. F0087]|nr:hypothetical protein HMPREF9074_09324 [Capnocytophaga sp. oral taxon 329 str. F0087]